MRAELDLGAFITSLPPKLTLSQVSNRSRRPLLKTSGIHHRLNTKAFDLRVQGLYEGAIDQQSIKTELEKVRKYIGDVKKCKI